MGFGSLNPQAWDEDVSRRLRVPPEAQATPFSLWSFMRAGATAIPGAALEVLGSLRDVSRAIDLRRQEDEDRRAAFFGRAPLRMTQIEGGEALRVRAEQLAPNPETAHTADVVMHTVGKIATKAVGGALLTGSPIAGGLMVGAEEGNTEAQRLMSRGVDPETAAKVGAVHGVGVGVGLALPAGGATWARTMAIAATGGPASFVGEEALSRRILQQSGYQHEADRHDPSDPLGIALSIIPSAAIGALHMRGVSRAAREKLSYAKERDLRQTATLTPTEQAASDAFERSEGNLRELRAAIEAEKNPANRAILEGELAKLTDKQRVSTEAAVVARAAEDPEMVAAARVQQLEEVSARDLPDTPTARVDVLRAADELAAGKLPEVRPIATIDLPEFRAWFGDSKVVDGFGAPLVMYHGTAKDFDAHSGPISVSADPSVSGVYAQKFLGDGRTAPDGGNIQPVYVRLSNPKLVDPLVLQVDRYDPQFVADAKAQGHDGLAPTGWKPGDRTNELVVFDPSQIKSAAGNSGKFDPTSGSLTDPLQPGELSPRLRHITETTEPPAANLEVQSRQAAGPSTGAATEAPKTVDAERLAQLEAENPDMRVILPGETESTTLADALRQARQTAEDEASFSDLVRVAAECALTVG